jgi:type 1 glutamine amidotransferase
MATMLRTILILIGAFMLSASAGAQPHGHGRHVLIFSHSTGYRHASIEAGVAAFEAMGARDGMTMIASEDPAVFSEAGLRGVDAIVLLSNSTRKDDPATEFFTDAQRAAFEAFVHRGGGVVAIHAAADSHYRWPWYGRMIGARFDHHPQGIPAGTVRVVDPRHPAARGLPASWSRIDEWYYFDDFNPEMRLLVTLDPASIGQADVNPNPVSWVHEFEGGRIFYTAMGHTAESYADPLFLRHVENGLNWVLRRH